MSTKKHSLYTFWFGFCIISSFISGFNLFLAFNSFSGINLSLLDGIFIVFVLTALSFTLSSPYVIYILIKERCNQQNRSKIKEFNLVFIVYFVILYFIFSNQMASYIEGFQLMISYLIVGLLALNCYFYKR